MLLDFSDPPLTLDLRYWQRTPPDKIFIVQLDEDQDIADCPIKSITESYKDTMSKQIAVPVVVHHKVTVTKIWWKKVLPGMLTFCLLVMALVIFPWVFFTSVHGATCESDECKAASRLFLSTMDFSVNPCEDFYKFVCGRVNWTSSTYVDHTTLIRERILETLKDLTEKIKPGESEPKAVEEVKIFYDSCKHREANFDAQGSLRFESLKEIIDSFIRPNESLSKTLGRIRRLTGQGYVVGLSVGPDLVETQTQRIFIDQPELAVPKQILLNKLGGEEYKEVIRDCLTKIWYLIYKRTSVNEINDTVRQISELETELAQAMTDADESTKPGMYNLISLDGLNEFYGRRQALEDTQLENGFIKSPLKLNWTEYVGTVFEGITPITGDTIVDVKDVQFIRGLAGLIAKSSDTLIRNYLTWQLLYTFGNDFFQRPSSSGLRKSGSLTITRVQQHNREIECIGLLDSLLPFALTYNFVQQNGDNKATIDEAESILKNIVPSFQEVVKDSSWMESGTKKMAIEKAGRVRAFLGYPKWLLNSTSLDEYYKGLYFKAGDFLPNVLIALKWISEKNLKSYNLPVDTSWSNFSPAEVDASYGDELNSITIPLGFLQPPFIGSGLRALDYGAIGFFMSHELTHGFDTEGRYSNAEGQLSQWWTPQTLENFNKKTHCIEEQYNHFFIPEINATVNGEQTLRENIADNGGFHLCFKAYHRYVDEHGPENLALPGLEQFSDDQLLFLSFAQSWCSYVSDTTLQDMVESNEHSPPKQRVHGSIANLPDFSRVWHCKNNSMNPSNKCQLW